MQSKSHTFIITAEHHRLTADGPATGRLEGQHSGSESLLEPTLKRSLPPMRAILRRGALDSQSQPTSRHHVLVAAEN